MTLFCHVLDPLYPSPLLSQVRPCNVSPPLPCPLRLPSYTSWPLLNHSFPFMEVWGQTLDLSPCKQKGIDHLFELECKTVASIRENVGCNMVVCATSLGVPKLGSLLANGLHVLGMFPACSLHVIFIVRCH
ncbi:hypothetical protein DUNSADRAFT_13368 [Dunaliella salina]|uniref:Uncharacterized protein n=1 Tax=Dunaliella salina TaxID=3046 RepID=A0ABQ7G9H4_DUNSA|nr:hypothetical protein DUNSADRAFT_13368 [Dunaliella salina]|eukprot:KAF5831260.1 hypothetical protein DUNSADRAFT_13368 [Dunaliella salina]